MNLLRTITRLLATVPLLIPACGKDDTPASTPSATATALTLSTQEITLLPGSFQTLRVAVEPAGTDITETDLALVDAETGQQTDLISMQFDSRNSDGSFGMLIRDNRISRKYALQMKVRCAKAGGLCSEVLTVRSTPYMPIVYLTSEQEVTSKDIWVKGTIRIDGGSAFDDLEQMAVEVKGRGNTTWSWEKKPYALKLDSKKSVLGMPKHKRWCLIANYMDRTHLRNRIAYYIGQNSRLAYTVRNEYAEFYMNGEYRGLFLLTEQIKEDPSRVNIAEMTTSDNDGEAVTGGYLLEMDTNYDEDRKFRSKYTNIPVNIKYPDPETLTDQQFNYIRDYVNKVDGLVYGSVSGDPFEYLDRESMIDFWIIFELMANHEVLHPKSIYFYKDRSGKLTAGPIWDFDYETLVEHTKTSWINYDLYYRPTEFPWYENNWWNKLLMNNASFRADVKRRWQEWYPFLQTVPTVIEQERKAIAEVESRNFQRWPNIDTGHPNRDETLSFAEAVNRLKSVYTTRLSWMNNEINKW